MIVSIHQPHFLPWLGYFNKVLNSDVFVWLHNVQYRKNYFQNRTKIKNHLTDSELWLTIPVRANLHMPIDQVTVADSKWNVKVFKTIDQYYRKAPFFDQYKDSLAELFSVSTNFLDAINYNTFIFFLGELKYTGKVLKIADLDIASDDPNQRLIEICNKVGSRRYIAGKGGQNYLNEPLWKEHGIELIWQKFNVGSVVYPQLGRNFIPALSIIDCILNIGPEKTRELILSAWTVE